VASLKLLTNQTYASELWLNNLSCGAQRRPTKRPLSRMAMLMSRIKAREHSSGKLLGNRFHG